MASSLSSSNSSLDKIKCQSNTNCKKTGISVCNGCKNQYCAEHLVEHRHYLYEQLQDVLSEKELFGQEVQSPSLDESSAKRQNGLFKEIDEWETEMIDAVKRTAKNGRKIIQKLANAEKHKVRENYDELSKEISERLEQDDYYEYDIERLKEEIETLKQKWNDSMTKTKMTQIQINFKDIDWSKILEVTAENKGKKNKIDDSEQKITEYKTTSQETFGEVCGTIEVRENGSLACNVNKDFFGCHSSVFGTNLYSTDIHAIPMRIEKMTNCMFFGIISATTAHTSNRSYKLHTSYGWDTYKKHAYLNGNRKDDYNNWDGNIIEADIIVLLIDCNEKRIQLVNNRTKSQYEMPIDIKCCPFPWRLNVNIGGHDNRIRILHKEKLEVHQT
ncbi:unnamed protein product [Didymodactylos carnosus]|uniref:B30.2/SPRY domain-containing protein n=1 Tax=Didymodactylos carnosus TaxID=1234261 RepID=A0A814D004_9BILA|nr:unnamed protein product [Didymodactylos carnosus]CAF1154335.1 unnamed protein product [Didymodactylos carnosus]CAF3726054.1 unnamed protein product [Didymodactylos carnosus]CAF3964257.1 unnamed protein product [Didymodactylos carnosus]